MTKAFMKNVRRTMTGSFGRYLAILLITFLGVGFVAGLKLTKPVMSTTEQEYLAEQEMFDLRLVSTIGFDEADVMAAADIDGVKAAAGSYYHDFITTQFGSEMVLRSLMLTEGVNEVSLKAGRMPVEANECLLDGDIFGEQVIGQVITLADVNDEETLESFACKEYIVTGLARSPLAISAERGTTSLGSGALTGYAYMTEEGFDFEYYTELYLRFDHDLAPYSEEYTKFIEEKTDWTTERMETVLEDRFNSLVADAEAEISDAENSLMAESTEAQQKLDDAWIELLNAKEDIETGEQEIADGRAELEEAKKELEDAAAVLQRTYGSLVTAAKAIYSDYTTFRSAYDYGMEQVEAAQTALDAAVSEGEQSLEAAKIELENGEIAYEAGIRQMVAMGYPEEMAKAQLSEKRASLDQGWAAYETGTTALAQQKTEGQAAIDESKTQLETFLSGVNAYNRGCLDYQEGYESYTQGCEDLAEAEEELEKGKQEYEDGLAEYEDGVVELAEKVADAEAEIADAKSELEDLEEPTLYVLDRTSNEGYVSFESEAAIVEDVAKIFPLFFFLIAALVCSTTMARMIDDDRTQIGTLRALGYSRKVMLLKYLLYSGSAGLIGGTLGYFVFGWLFPKVIWITYGMLYKIDGYVVIYNGWLYLILMVAALLCTCGTTYLALRKEMQDMPAELIRPKAPQAGKRILLERIGFIWNRLSFLRKVAMRNIFRFKKRMFMMVLGIAGCTALILTGFGIHDSVALVCDFQYNDIMKYDISLMCRNKTDEENLKQILDGMEDQIEVSTILQSSSADVEGGSMVKSTRMVVSDDPNLTELIDLHNNGEKVAFPGKGEVVLTEKLAALTGYAVGDTITLALSETEKADFVISGLTENYVYNYIYINAETYESGFSREYEPETIYLRLMEGADDHRIGAELSERENVLSVSLVSNFKKMVDNMMQSLNYVVAVVLLSAAGLAFVVLFNLGNINISERVREIATLKVLGFRRRETGQYVFRENLFLAIMGIIPGLPLGVLLHRFVLAQINVDMVNFKVTINTISYLFTVLMVLVFAYLTDLILRSKIERIHMAESLKSVE